jgi:hypothetical protein
MPTKRSGSIDTAGPAGKDARRGQRLPRRAALRARPATGLRHELAGADRAEWKQHDAQAEQLAAELADIDRSLRRQGLRLEEHDDPDHPVVALATRRIEELSARRAATTAAIEKLTAARAAGGHPNDILAMLEAVPDLRDRLRRGDPRLLAGIYEDFKVTATYEKATSQLTLEATVDATLATDAEAQRPPEGRPR